MNVPVSDAESLESGATWKDVAAVIWATHCRVVVTRTAHVLPFAAIGALLAHPGWPPLGPSVLLVACVLFGRAAAVGWLRFFEAPADVVNPIPSELPESPPPPRPVWLMFALHGVGMLIFLAYMANTAAGHLACPYSLLLVIYAWARHRTGLAHVLLGLGLAAAPAAAWVVYRGDLDGAWTLAPLGLGIVAWAAGFDIVYSLRPEAREGTGPGVFRPMNMDVQSALRVADICSFTAVILFAAMPLVEPLSPVFYAAPVLIAGFLWLARRGVTVERWVSVSPSFLRWNMMTGPVLLAAAILAR